MQMEVAIKTNTFRDAAREQTSILAPLERAALRGLARRMPAWVNSDHLSVLGLLGMIGAGVCYAVAAFGSAHHGLSMWILCRICSRF